MQHFIPFIDEETYSRIGALTTVSFTKHHQCEIEGCDDDFYDGYIDDDGRAVCRSCRFGQEK